MVLCIEWKNSARVVLVLIGFFEADLKRNDMLLRRDMLYIRVYLHLNDEERSHNTNDYFSILTSGEFINYFVLSACGVILLTWPYLENADFVRILHFSSFDNHYWVGYFGHHLKNIWNWFKDLIVECNKCKVFVGLLHICMFLTIICCCKNRKVLFQILKLVVK